MPWAKIDDQFFENPKVRRAGKDGREMYLSALCYSAGALTDGFIHADDLLYIAARAQVKAASEVADLLVALRLWELVENGYMIHDYHTYNPSAEQVKREREQNAQRQADWRRRREEKRSERPEGKVDASNAVSNGVSARVPSPSPSPVTSTGASAAAAEANISNAVSNGVTGAKVKTLSGEPLPPADGEAYGLYLDAHAGRITPIIAEHLRGLVSEYSEHWVAEAIRDASLSGCVSPSIKYLTAILDRWRRDGFKAQRPVAERGQTSAANRRHPQKDGEEPDRYAYERELLRKRAESAGQT